MPTPESHQPERNDRPPAVDQRPPDWAALTLALFRRLHDDLTDTLSGASEQILDWQPTPHTNTVGWLIWHIARGQDRNISEMAGHRQHWLTHGWAERFGRPADPSDTGFGHSTAQAVAFRSPGIRTSLAYHKAVHELTEAYLRSAPPDDLNRVVASPTLGNVHTVNERLRGLIADSFAHLGQVALLLGMATDDPQW